MAVNVEIKASVGDFRSLRELVEQISDTPCEKLIQEDVYFNIEKGRLKLRIFSPDHGELIYYERADSTGPKQSNYFISPSSDPGSLKHVLSLALGIRGVVKKERLVYMVGYTRVHLDQVEHLGSFLELEVVLQPNQTHEQGQKICDELMEKLNVSNSDLLDVAYIDLLESNS